MRVQIHYESRFGFRHHSEEVSALKVSQAVRVLHQAGCSIKAVSVLGERQVYEKPKAK